MGIFNFWKKKEEEKQENSLDFNSTILEKKERIIAKESLVVETLKTKVLKLTEELKREIVVLEEVDLKDSKSDQRLKFIVLENLANYVKSLERLIQDLENISNTKSEEYILEIQNAFTEFKEKSKVSREKSTYLIGKEIRDVKDSIGNFFKDIDDFIKEEGSFFSELNLLKEAEKISNEIKQLNKRKLDLDEEKIGFENEISSLSDELEKVLSSIKSQENNEEYKNQLNKKEQVEGLKEKLKKDLIELKNLVDFKMLSKMYHHDSKKLAIIKEYEDNFSKILYLENVKLLELIDDAKREKVIPRIGELKKVYSEISNLINNKNSAEILEEEKTNLEERIKEANSELEKRIENLKIFYEEEENLINQIKIILEKIDSNYRA